LTNGYFYEVVVLSILLASGFSLAWLLGARKLSQAVPLGLGLAILWRVLSHSALYFFGLGDTSQLVWLIGSLLIIAVVGVLRFREARLWLGLASSFLAGLVSATLTRGLGIRGIPHSDSLWIMTLSDLMQKAGDMQIVGGRTAIKRGFAYPTTLALGPDGSWLTGLTPLIYIALIAAIIWVVLALAPKLDWKSWLWVLMPLLVVVISAPIILRAIWYVNGHTLTALGIVLGVGSVAIAVRDQRLERLGLWTLMTGLALISMTRPEGVAFAALIAAPLISRRWISAWDVRLIVFSALGSFGIWMYLYDGYIPNLLRLYDERFPIAMLIGSYLVGFKIFNFFRFRLVPLAFIGMGGLLLFILVRNFASLQDDIWAQIQNMFLGEGFWGGFFIALVLVVPLLGWKIRSENYRLLAVISGLLILGSVVAKLLDGGLFGDPTLGRLGWTDSLNRMWLHSFAIFIITILIGYAETVTKKAVALKQ
jgi:hypothetical protein